MFNLGLPEMLVIGAAALLVFGPKRLPELAKSLGKGIRDFKKAVDGSGTDDDATDDPKREEAKAHALPPESPKDTVPKQTTESKEPASSDKS